MTDTLRSLAFGALATLLGTAFAGCASTAPAPPAPSPAAKTAPAAATVLESPNPPAPSRTAEVPYPSTYQPLPSQPVLITNATLLTATGDRIARGSILLRDGKV